MRAGSNLEKGFTPGGCAKVQLDRMSHGVKICSASDCSRDAVGSLPYTPEWAARVGSLPYGSGQGYQVSVPFCSEHLKTAPKKIKESQSRKSTSGRLVVWSLVHLVYGLFALAAPIRYGSRSDGPGFFFKVFFVGVLLLVIGFLHNHFTLEGVV